MQLEPAERILYAIAAGALGWLGGIVTNRVAMAAMRRRVRRACHEINRLHRAHITTLSLVTDIARHLKLDRRATDTLTRLLNDTLIYPAPDDGGRTEERSEDHEES